MKSYSAAILQIICKNKCFNTVFLYETIALFSICVLCRIGDGENLDEFSLQKFK